MLEKTNKGGISTMGKGSLMVQARTAENALPLSGVRIKIMDHKGKILHDLLTDEGGQTLPVSLDAVNKKHSMDANYKDSPYSTYELEAVKNGFNSLHIADIQIFDGQEAIQPVDLMPLLEDQTTPIRQQRFFGKHAIEMEGDMFAEESPPQEERFSQEEGFPQEERFSQEEGFPQEERFPQEGRFPQEERVPQDEGSPRKEASPIRVTPFMLPQVIIPGEITVHLGAPSSPAQNVRVPFPDYIKNVACGEIYSTWPEAALRANIYAIITFALNRVFTEWYRSRGYNFDITSLPAYDQIFVYGRTIYASISRIVDEIFDRYVRKAGQIAPYFTCYCNGTTSTCSGLSQWGTVSLANQGKSALEILRSYYPKDVEISQVNIISGFVESFPGTNLCVGSRGRDVETVQSFLTRIKKNYPSLPAITDAAGVFDGTTEAAVKKFQSLFDLTPDGVVGRTTWNKLNYIYATVTKLADLDSEGTTLGIGKVPPNVVIRTGAAGLNVVILQHILNVISRFCSTVPEVVADGSFGKTTEAAVAAFQRMEDLNTDGIVGPATWNALYETYWGIENNVFKNQTLQYTVKAGDSLWAIAQRYNTTVAAVRSLNNLNSDLISVGQVLLISGSGETTATPENPAPLPLTIQYTVKAGDSLWAIAQRYNTTVAAIKSLNNLSSDALSIGQVLFIAGGETTVTPGNPAPQPLTIQYTVKAGDSLWAIAQKYNTTVAAIKTLNNLSSDLLSVGQVLYIPGQG